MLESWKLLAGATTPGAAAAAAAAAKHKKYEQNHVLGPEHLVPLALETHGTLCKEGHAFIKKVADARYPGDGGVAGGGDDRRHASRARYIRGLRERIAVTLQRSNAAVIRGHVHTCVPAG